MGLKSLGIRRSFTLRVQRWVRGGNIYRDIQLGTYRVSEGCKLGSDVMFDGFHFFIYRGMHVFIDGGNIGTELPHFLLGLCGSRGQGIEAGFQVLATGVGHDEEGKGNGLWVKGIMTIRAMRGIQWGKAQIRVLGPREKNLLKNDRYDCDKGEERNPTR
jgi:hypothetical protein